MTDLRNAVIVRFQGAIRFLYVLHVVVDILFGLRIINLLLWSASYSLFARETIH